MHVSRYSHGRKKPWRQKRKKFEMHSVPVIADEARARLRGIAQRNKGGTPMMGSDKKAAAEAADRTSAAARVSAAHAAAAADKADRNAPARLEVGSSAALLSTSMAISRSYSSKIAACTGFCEKSVL